jgi:hypothetical protein
MRALLGLIVIIILGLVVASSLHLINFTTSGKLEAPKVQTVGGSVPNVEVNTGKINIGTENKSVAVPTVKTEEKTVKVPSISVEKAKDSQ